MLQKPLLTRIPRILHQTNAHAALPAELAEHVRKLQVQNPGWRYEFYDDNACVEFIRKNYDPRIQKAYDRINPRYGAARADFFRYLLIYRVGGVYLDLKSGLTKRLDDIVSSHEYLLSHWDNGPDGTHPGWGGHFSNFPQGEFQNWYVAAAPPHAILRAVIEQVLNNIENYTVERFGVGPEGVFYTTGPVAYTEAIVPLLKSANYHLERTNYKMGFIFNALGPQYRKLVYESRPHYSALDEPVVLPG